MLIFTAFIIVGKFTAISSILNDELASNDTTIAEQVCAVSNNSISMVE